MRRAVSVLTILAMLVIMVGSALPAMAQQGSSDWGNNGSNWSDNNSGNNGSNWGDNNWWGSNSYNNSWSNYSPSCDWYWSYWDGWTQWCWSPWSGWFQPIK